MKELYFDDPRVLGTIPVSVLHNGGSRKLYVPVFDPNSLGEKNSSGYMRMAAEKLFRKLYSPCQAWQRKYRDKLIALMENGRRNLGEYADEGILTPGMGIGFFDPLNLNNWKKDKEGYIIHLTHFALYLGRSAIGKPNLMVAHRYDDATYVEAIDDFKYHFKKKLLTPKEIVDSRN